MIIPNRQHFSRGKGEENSLTPELIVMDINKSLNFYTKILDFKVIYDRPEKKFAMLEYQGSRLMINERNGWWETGKLEYPLGRGVNFQIKTDNIEKIRRLLNTHNYPVYQEIEEVWYRRGDKELGQKELLVQDPDGYLLRFAQDLGEKDWVH
ncbi:hypothetical protein A3F03_03565 [Candidatus Roizmanbacteria bacterium RIFCSPHIGHO2_12_FULL_41_11]|uniref:Bleomycin resistance protein n=1 Tax=Candidatus Roizmanbacteria bacterium RIFCSPHIGHO2_12_FULL_41_11 TaxID=1802052 RepID=A0A1F7I5L7_9BACT|nr:MAG: hypothetical protein A3F03_03565 [Candidatus Roizmanbacteria bacterium RIFCSPHIGHO2_12_FULL_41_11]